MDDGTFIRVPVARQGVEQAAAALDRFCASHHVPADSGWRLQVSLDEALSNVIRHGSAVPRATIGVGMRVVEDSIEVTVTDSGPAFDPLGAVGPDRGVPLEARVPGGLGIVLVRALMDDVRYERREDVNVLTLRKRFAPRTRSKR